MVGAGNVVAVENEGPVTAERHVGDLAQQVVAGGLHRAQPFVANGRQRREGPCLFHMTGLHEHVKVTAIPK